MVAMDRGEDNVTYSTFPLALVPEIQKVPIALTIVTYNSAYY